VKQASDRRKLLGGAIGNIGEQFDYSIYALVAPTLATHFFPGTNSVAALLSTFAVYALSFVARPFGGVLFGYIGDKHGRLAVLTWTVVLMGGGTMLVGLLPTYETIGVAAPILLVVCRLLQGLSLGGETTGVESYIAESAPDGKRASWMATVMSFVYWPAAAVAVFVLGVRSVMSTAAFDSWGWRIPFLLGGVVAVVGYVLRRTLDDPDEYKEAKAEYQQTADAGESTSVVRALGASFGTRKSMLLVILLQPPMAIAAYLLTGYMYTFVVREGGLSPMQGLLSNSAAIAVLAALLPVMGRLSDRFGRKRMYLAGAMWLFLMAYPAFRLAGAGNVAAAFGGQVLLAIGISIYASALFVGMVELFPTAVRCRSHGISYNISVALFGGTTPLIATALIGGTGSPVAPAFYAMAMIAVIGLVGVLLVPETKNVSLRYSIFEKPDDARSTASADTPVRSV
jgi:MHS family proline/betaine transporter-like MFS transporter